MADESCVFPGESSRAPGQWLDRDTAERLLSGVSPDASGEIDRPGGLGPLDARADAEAARLIRALRSLATASAPAHRDPVGLATGGEAAELPGEAAALAAFRAVRAERPRGAADGQTGRARPAGAGPRAVPGAQGFKPTALPLGGPEDGPVRLGEVLAPAPARWARPVRFSVAAALAACMLGGVAVAAGTGILPSPFGGDGPSPTVSVSDTADPDHPLTSPLLKPRQPDGPAAGRPSAGDSARDPADGSKSAPPDQPDDEPQHTPSGKGPDAGKKDDPQPGGGGKQEGDWWSRVVKACKDYRGGKTLDDDNLRRLRTAAHGSQSVQHYCDAVLGENEDPQGSYGGQDPGSGDGGGAQPGGVGDPPDSDGDGSTPGDGSGDPMPSTPSTPSMPSMASGATPDIPKAAAPFSGSPSGAQGVSAHRSTHRDGAPTGVTFSEPLAQ